jgi:hypothetical protein
VGGRLEQDYNGHNKTRLLGIVKTQLLGIPLPQTSVSTRARSLSLA